MNIAVIIPTMWVAGELEQSIRQLVSYDQVGEIIIIDNNVSSRPQWISGHASIRILSSDFNRGVAASWNLAVSLASSDLICLLNDDIQVDQSVFRWVSVTGLSSCSVLGMASDLFEYSGPFRVKRVDLRPDGWGQCMFLRREQYIPIPLLHSFFTDDFLFDHVPVYTRRPNYQFYSSVRGRRSVTSGSFQREFIQDREHYNRITSLYPRYAYR